MIIEKIEKLMMRPRKKLGDFEGGGSAWTPSSLMFITSHSLYFEGPYTWHDGKSLVNGNLVETRRSKTVIGAKNTISIPCNMEDFTKTVWGNHDN